MLHQLQFKQEEHFFIFVYLYPHFNTLCGRSVGRFHPLKIYRSLGSSERSLRCHVTATGLTYFSPAARSKNSIFPLAHLRVFYGPPGNTFGQSVARFFASTLSKSFRPQLRSLLTEQPTNTRHVCVLQIEQQKQDKIGLAKVRPQVYTVHVMKNWPVERLQEQQLRGLSAHIGCGLLPGRSTARIERERKRKTRPIAGSYLRPYSYSCIVWLPGRPQRKLHICLPLIMADKGKLQTYTNQPTDRHGRTARIVGTVGTCTWSQLRRRSEEIFCMASGRVK